eukprot:6723838-Pyramimonas_sp.AAC.1
MPSCIPLYAVLYTSVYRLVNRMCGMSAGVSSLIGSMIAAAATLKIQVLPIPAGGANVTECEAEGSAPLLAVVLEGAVAALPKRSRVEDNGVGDSTRPGVLRVESFTQKQATSTKLEGGQVALSKAGRATLAEQLMQDDAKLAKANPAPLTGGRLAVMRDSTVDAVIALVDLTELTRQDTDALAARLAEGARSYYTVKTFEPKRVY